jgi:acetyl-CoA synthetase
MVAATNPIVNALQHRADTEPDEFWAQEASKLHWFHPWSRVFEFHPPEFQWFVGGKTNLSYNCLDRHIEDGRGGHAALVYENERGERRALTYHQLWSQAKRVAAALRGLGVARGDRVAIYMPTMPEAIVAMLACTRIGAIHVVVFAGFGSGALSERIRLSGAKVLLTADVTYRRGKDTPLLDIVGSALAEPETPVEKVVIHHRGAEPPTLRPGRDLRWEEFLAGGEGHSDAFESMESNEPAYILATSGTTAKPKLVVHVHGGYSVWIRSTSDWVFDLRPDDIWWSTSDIGWVVGHSFIVYAPLLVGCTTLAYEGAIDHPGPQSFYRVIQENGVTGVFTAPTAIRLLMGYGTDPAKPFDLHSLNRVFSAGEVLNPAAWEWMQKQLFHDRVPVVDHMWQTETGGPVFANPYGVSLLPIKPGSAGIPLPGIHAEIRAPDGARLGKGEKGIVVLTQPFPGLTPTLWKDPERYQRDYWMQVPGTYYTGDAAYVDDDGYFFFSGRADEILKIAGHRIGTIEVESAFLRHPAVGEVGVVGRPDALRGEVAYAFVALKKGETGSRPLKEQLVRTVRQELGPVAVIGDIYFVSTLPKTRSGKIMRRVLKSVLLDRDPGDISSIEDEGSVEEARRAWHLMRAEVAGDSTSA